MLAKVTYKPYASLARHRVLPLHLKYVKSRLRSSEMVEAVTVDQYRVVYEYLEAYSAFICAMAPQPHICMEQMIVPSVDEQVRVVNELSNVQANGLEGIFMKLILLHEDEAIQTLEKAMEQHDTSEKVIRAILDYASSKPIYVQGHLNETF